MTRSARYFSLAVLVCSAAACSSEDVIDAPDRKASLLAASDPVPGHYIVVLDEQSTSFTDVGAITDRLSQGYGAVITHRYRSALIEAANPRSAER